MLRLTDQLISEHCVEKFDAVDLDIEIRSRTVLGLKECAVLDDLGVTLICFVAVNVSHIAGEVTVGVNGSVDVLVLGDRYGECGNVINFDLTALEFGFRLFDRIFGTLGSSLGVDFGQADGSGLNGAGPVSIDSLTLFYAIDVVLEVGLLVDSGRNDEGVRASLGGRTVVRNVGNAGVFAGGGSAH